MLSPPVLSLHSVSENSVQVGNVEVFGAPGLCGKSDTSNGPSLAKTLHRTRPFRTAALTPGRGAGFSAISPQHASESVSHPREHHAASGKSVARIFGSVRYRKDAGRRGPVGRIHDDRELR